MRTLVVEFLIAMVDLVARAIEIYKKFKKGDFLNELRTHLTQRR